MCNEQTNSQNQKQNDTDESYSVCMEIAGAESIPEANYTAPTVEECE